MAKGSEAVGVVSALGANGEGIVVEANGFQVHLAGVLPGEEVRYRVTQRSQHSAQGWGEVRAVSQRSPAFVKPPCHHAAPLRGQCGGCPLMHLDATAQAAWKAEQVGQALQAQGLAPELSQAHGAPQGLAYRNRCNYVVCRRPQGGVRLGSFAPRSHQVADMDGCLVLLPHLAEVARKLRSLLVELAVPVAPEGEGLRYVTVVGNPAGESLIELISSSAAPSWLPALSDLLRSISGVVGASHGVNASPGNSIRAEGPVALLWGREHIDLPLGRLVAPIRPSAFFQLNHAVAGAIYARIAALLQPMGCLWDLYCGVGSIGLNVAPQGHLFGAEAAPEAVALAQAAAARLGQPATFVACDLRQGLPQGWPTPDAIVVNPPRRGVDPALLAELAAAKAAPIVYMSCNPSTFARDARVLVDAGYRLSAVEIFDMLPQTGHVEVLGRLEV